MVERDQIVDALRERGVTYLAGGRGCPSGLSDAELIRALVESYDARLRLALIPLFLSRPALALQVPSILAQLEPQHALDLKQRYTAALCLQRFWRTRLSEVVLDVSPLPDWFSAELGLPSLNEQHGKWALYALADQMALAHDGVDFLASFNKTFEHFVRQREVEALRHEPAEEASPADFIPLPAGAGERAIYIGRYGQIDVFHYDLYSLALSKIERGSEDDRDDVLALLQSGRIEMPLLQKYFDEIIVRYGEQSLRQDPARFRGNFDALKQTWSSLKAGA